MFNLHKKFFFIFILSILFACNNSNKKDLINTEEKNDKVLYFEAMEDFKEGYYSTAAKNFEKIESDFIFTPLASKSVIMAVYSYYKATKYDDCLRLIEYYKKINFDNSYLEYMHYMEILSKYKKSIKSKKDLTLMNDLYSDIEYMLNYYKNSIYKKDILEKRKRIVDNIVKNELSINNFYINNNNIIGAINHLNIILERFDNTKYMPEIIYKLLVLYRHIDYKEGIDKYYNILKNNYKNTKWYKYANK